MPYSPISVRQINQSELNTFVNQTISVYSFSGESINISGNQSITGLKTFVDPILPQAGFIFSKKYINGNYTVNNPDYILCVNASGAAKTLTFPLTGFITGKEYRIKDFLGLSETNPITLTGNGVTFDYKNSFKISGNYASLSLIGGSGSNYEIN
jgi:hypothetical protein